MKKIVLTFYILLSLIICTNANPNARNSWLANAVSTACYQIEMAASKNIPGQNPRSIQPDGKMQYADVNDWTCGFFPGSLWYMYEISENPYFLEKAKLFTEALDSAQYFTYIHDLGFMLYCSYGNGFRLTKKQEYKDVLLQAATSLSTRYNSKTGCIRSWDFGKWQYPVIIDNLMNLELLLWASENTKDRSFYEIAISHSLKTMENHYRDDFSCFHVVSYDTLNGNVVEKETFQGYSDESSWARGQAWGLYGFTMLYKLTGNTQFLNQAKSIARFLISHTNMPIDGIPYWDFDAPDIPHAPRDASAAAIIASALIDLSNIDNKSDKDFFPFAEKILMNLSNENYLAKKGENGFFILKHSVGAYPLDVEIDTPINYADYYYLEGLIKYCRNKNIAMRKLAGLN